MRRILIFRYDFFFLLVVFLLDDIHKKKKKRKVIESTVWCPNVCICKMKKRIRFWIFYASNLPVEMCRISLIWRSPEPEFDTHICAN